MIEDVSKARILLFISHIILACFLSLEANTEVRQSETFHGTALSSFLPAG